MRRAWWARRRGRVDDLALFAVTLGGAGAIVLNTANNERLDAFVWVGVGLTVAMAVTMWWRRRVPLLLAVAGCVVVALGASQVVLSVTLATLAVRRRDRVLGVVTAGAVAAKLIAPWHLGLPGTVGGWVNSQVLTLLVFVVLPVVSGAFIGARRDLLASLRERAERAETEQQLRTEQARAAERTRIAREMHDALGHRISLVALHAGGLEVSATSPQVTRSAELIRTTAHEALQDLREILGVLREGSAEAVVDQASVPPGRVEDRLPPPDLLDLPALVRSSADTGARMRLVDELPPGAEVPVLVGRTAYRVAQEALTNVHKHAPHATTTVRLSGASGEELVVEVHNTRPPRPRRPPELFGFRARPGRASRAGPPRSRPVRGHRHRRWIRCPRPPAVASRAGAS